MLAVTRLPGIALGLATAIGLPAAATAQQLWSVEEVSAQPVAPIVMDGMAVSSAAASGSTAGAATVQVTYDYLRLGMGYLELPLPDGSVISAENAVFEDRGNGNLMWTGEVPGAGYESVLFTVQDGHLVGWFGELGGPKYVVYAGPDGRGSLAVEEGPTGDWCGVEAGTGPDLLREATAAADRPMAVTSQSLQNRGVEVLFDTTCTAMSTTELHGGRDGRPARPARPRESRADRFAKSLDSRRGEGASVGDPAARGAGGTSADR